MLGDLNIDYSKNEINTRKLKQLANERQLKQLIKAPTRTTLHTETVKDLIFTNCEHVTKSGVIHCGISDHDLIYIVRKKSPPRHDKISFRGRSYKNLNLNNLKDNLQSMDWETFYHSTDPNICWDLMLDNITKIADQQCPLRDIHLRK